MYSDPVAYFLTFTTYGTWLHGRETGSVDREHNQFGSPTLPANAKLEARQRLKMRQPEYRLDGPQREIVIKTILEVAQHRQWHVWAAHVRSNHVHVVITATPKPEKVLNDLKAWCSRRMKEVFSEPADRERWTRHGSTRYVWTEKVLAEKIRYVLDEQGERMAWYCDSSIRAESVSAGIVSGNNITHPTTTMAMPSLTLSALNILEAAKLGGAEEWALVQKRVDEAKA